MVTLFADPALPKRQERTRQVKNPSLKLSKGTKVGIEMISTNSKIKLCRLTDAYEEVSFGFEHSIFARKNIEFLLGGECGHGDRDPKNADDICDSGVWAWERIPQRLFRWAWLDTGLITVAQMAEMNGVSEDDIKNDSDYVHGLSKNGFFIDEAPVNEPTTDEQRARINNIPVALLPPVRVWVIASRSASLAANLLPDEWCALPTMFNPALEGGFFCFCI